MLKTSLNLNSLGRILSLLFLLTGVFFGGYSLLIGSSHYPNIVPAHFLDSIPISLDWVNLGTLSFPIEVDNFLVFQEYQALPPGFTLSESYLFGGIVFLTVVSALAVFSTFKKIPFLIFGAVWIVLLTLTNTNGLNIGSPSSNYPLIIMIAGTVLPVIYFHVWKPNSSFWLRWTSILIGCGGAVLSLIKLSPIPNSSLYLAEHSLIIGLGMVICWIFWQGHGVISGVYILLARANQNVGVKISWQILAISTLYFLTLIFLLLDLKGEANLPFPTFSPLLLILPIGILGWFSTSEKLRQVPENATEPNFLKALFILGFGFSFWMIWKLEISGNLAAEEFLKHLIVYSQFGFSLFFVVYLFSNFLSVMDSGKAVDKILFKPYSLPYYHLRIGGMITLLVVIVYMDAVLAPQVNSLTTNILGDYYYQTGKKLEASILYENSWDAYRKNPKAKNATAHLLFELNQPTLAKEHLDQSFSEAPQVDNIILHSAWLIRENKPLEAVYYLENGLRRFPKNLLLRNNLALLYARINKTDEALGLLQNAPADDPLLSANLIALESKLKKEQAATNSNQTIISLINQLASNNLTGYQTPESETRIIQEDLEKQSTPMLLNAGIRNLFSIPNFSNTTADLIWIDSMSSLPEMIDYLMLMQETASIRSLSADRVTEAIKNLNGLAFRNPAEAGNYLNLTSGILAQNLDFEKSARDITTAEQKGFKGLRPHHLTILRLGGYEEKALELESKYLLPSSNTLDDFLILLSRFNQSIPDKLFDQWNTIGSVELKSTFGFLLLERKAHGLTKFQLNELGNFLEGKIENEEQLAVFLQNPDWSNQESLLAFTQFLQVGEELSANPYKTPLVLSAAERLSDPLDQYELLNTASEFNKDPMLWIRKVQAARRIGLDNYATAALQEMSNWLSWDEIEFLQGTNY